MQELGARLLANSFIAVSTLGDGLFCDIVDTYAAVIRSVVTQQGQQQVLAAIQGLSETNAVKEQVANLVNRFPMAASDVASLLKQMTGPQSPQR